jgi:hypothetical protein
MRIAVVAVLLAIGTVVVIAQDLPADKSGDSPHSTGRTVSPESKGQMQPQGPTGPIDTTQGGAAAESPQGQTPPGMQAAPGGSSKTVVDPDAREKGSQANNATSPAGGSKQEQSLKSSEHDPSAVYRNGVLAVPGADANVQTAPAKFSKRSDAADKLPMAAYALRHLTSEQRASIYRTLYKTLALTGEAPLTSAVVGTEIPTHVSLAGLEPVPERITSVMPELEGLSFVRAGDKILLTSPTMHRVLAVLE